MQSHLNINSQLRVHHEKLSGVEEGCCLENLPTSQDILSLVYFQNWGLLAGFVAAACQNVCGGPCPSPSPSKSWQFESLSLSYLNLPQWGWGDGAGSLTLHPSLPIWILLLLLGLPTNGSEIQIRLSQSPNSRVLTNKYWFFLYRDERDSLTWTALQVKKYTMVGAFHYCAENIIVKLKIIW